MIHSYMCQLVFCFRLFTVVHMLDYIGHLVYVGFDPFISFFLFFFCLSAFVFKEIIFSGSIQVLFYQIHTIPNLNELNTTFK